MCVNEEHYTCLAILLRIATLVCFLSGMYHAGVIVTEARTVQTNTTMSNITRNWGLWVKCTINETNGTVVEECSALYPGETAAYYEGARVSSCLAFLFFLCQFISICWNKGCTGTAPAFYTLVGVVFTALLVVVVGDDYSNDAHWRDLSPSLGWCYWLELGTIIIGVMTTGFLYHKGRLESDDGRLFCACLIAWYRKSSSSSESEVRTRRLNENDHSHVDLDGIAAADGQPVLQPHRISLFHAQPQLRGVIFDSVSGSGSGEREGSTRHVEIQLARELRDMHEPVPASPTLGVRPGATRTLPSFRQMPSWGRFRRLFPLLVLPPYEETPSASDYCGADVPQAPPPSYDDVLLELSRAATQATQTMSNPELPVLNPELPVLNPDLPVLNPELPVLNPELPVSNPELPVLNPELPVSNPFSGT